MKEPLLYLCHRMPFPPNKGDKITTFNVLKFLSSHYDVYLGTFIDDPFDEQYCQTISQYCKQCHFVRLYPSLAKAKGLKAFLTGEPITLPFYQSRNMQKWVNDKVTTKGIKKAFIYSACMAQYVLKTECKHMHKVIQFADIDSDKWRQFALRQNALMRKVYTRESIKLFDYEKYVAEQFDLSFFISDAEVSLFKSMIAPALHHKIKTLSNGIDSEFFSATADAKLSENFQLRDENFIVFTGAMDYEPNVETVFWFIQHVWLNVVKQMPNSKFYIVGSSPSKKVLNLSKYPGVVVTGRVADIRPYLIHAKAAVAPMQIARGIQNKILEAMAMELPVLTTKLGAEGFENFHDTELFVTDCNKSMQSWVHEKLDSPYLKAFESREWLQNNYSWNTKLSPLLEFLDT